MSKNKKNSGANNHEKQTEKKQPEKKPEMSAEELKELVVNEALLLAHHKKFHINDLTKYALKYEELATTP